MSHEVTVMIADIVITIAALLLFRYILPWAKNKLIYDWVMKAVKAAEQTHGAGTGQVKKADVLKFINNILKKYHINITAEELEVLIESAVKSMNIEILNSTKS